MQFFSPDEFCRYNMFNHHFFNSVYSQTVRMFVHGIHFKAAIFSGFLCCLRQFTHCLQIFEEFLANDQDILVVVDPPFGGLVEVLAHTLETISSTTGIILAETSLGRAESCACRVVKTPLPHRIPLSWGPDIRPV